jgi:sugar phosphate isomerase/epimerase
MEIGIFAKTFPGTDAARVLNAVKGSGFASVQFNMSCAGMAALPQTIERAKAEEIRRASASTGVKLAAVSATYNMVHPDQAQRDAGFKSFSAIAAIAGAMGTGLVTLCTGSRDPQDQWQHHPENQTPETWALLIAEMNRVAAVADQYGVMLGLEPELGNVMNNTAAAQRLLGDIGSPHLGIVLDPANLFEVADGAEQQRLIAEAIEVLGDRLVMAHAKDRNRSGGFVAAGTGVIDFSDFVMRLRAVGFDGPLITHGLSAQAAPGVGQFLHDLISDNDKKELHK